MIPNTGSTVCLRFEYSRRLLQQTHQQALTFWRFYILKIHDLRI